MTHSIAATCLNFSLLRTSVRAKKNRDDVALNLDSLRRPGIRDTRTATHPASARRFCGTAAITWGVIKRGVSGRQASVHVDETYSARSCPLNRYKSVDQPAACVSVSLY